MRDVEGVRWWAALLGPCQEFGIEVPVEAAS